MATDTLTKAPTTEDGGHKLLAWMREMRDEHPVWRDEYGAWHVFRFADVERVFSDPALFSSDTARLLPEARELTEGSIISMDPPLHRKLRRLISAAFTPKVVAGLAPRIAAVTNELLDATGGAREWQLVNDLAYPLPVIVIAELLGLPTSDRGLFRSWADGLFDQITVEDPNDPELMAQVEAAMADMRAYLREACQDRRARPREDLISKLAAAEVDGERLTDNEVVGFSTVLLLAGHITTTALLGNTVLCFDEHPEMLAEVRADRSLVPAALEEVLRYRSPFAQMGRVTMRETELSGTTVPADVFVLPWILSANRDERAFPDPDRFDIHRAPKHLAFGHGIHFCLGAPLARLEAKVALNILLDRYSEIRVDPGADMTFYPVAIFAAREVPITVRNA